MESLRIPLLACLIAGSMGGVLYAGVKAERATATPSELQPLPAYEALAELVPEEPEEPELPLGLEAPIEPDLTVAIDLGENAVLFPDHEDIELADGVRIGLLFDPEEFFEEELEEAPAPLRRTARAPSRPPGPRLHSDPGMHSVLTARAMMAAGEEIHGSCYAYLSEVYARAGHSSWRKRTIVYRQGRTGPYADLDLIRPGDWLYIVTGPNSTHSVMFVGWSDRAHGYARTISHPGWFAGPHTGRESSYDVSQTYRIIRPTN